MCGINKMCKIGFRLDCCWVLLILSIQRVKKIKRAKRIAYIKLALEFK